MDLKSINKDIVKLREDLRISEKLLKTNQVDQFELINEIDKLRHDIKNIEIFHGGINEN